VHTIRGSFGSKRFDIDAYVYDSVEDKVKAEQKTKKQRDEEKRLRKNLRNRLKRGKVQKVVKVLRGTGVLKVVKKSLLRKVLL